MIKVADLSGFVSELCRLCVGVIRSAHPTSINPSNSAISSSQWFGLLVPITKLLRSILDRATRIPNLVHENAWTVDFPISDFSGNAK